MADITMDQHHLTLDSVLKAAKALAPDRKVDPSGLGGRLQKLIDHLNRDHRLDAKGLAAATATIAEILVERQRLLDDRAAHAEIGAEAIKQPIFATGLPRSGTTLLHMLLAADPENRMPQWWEVARPSPPPALGLEVAARRAKADDDIAALVAADPSLLQSHPYFDQGGATAAECEHFGVLDFHFARRTMYYFRLPVFVTADLLERDEDFFASHRKILQHLQWRAAPRRWALKGTEHHVRLGALKAVYPDAKVIWIHRDPLKVLPSTIALYCNLAEGLAGKAIDRRAFAAGLFERYGQMIDKAMASPFVRHRDVHHLRYADFAAAPVDSVRRAYEALGLPFGEETGAAMEGWLKDPRNRGDRHGKFSYSLAEFGLERADVESRFAAYRAAFDIPLEAGRG